MMIGETDPARIKVNEVISALMWQSGCHLVYVYRLSIFSRCPSGYTTIYTPAGTLDSAESAEQFSSRIFIPVVAEYTEIWPSDLSVITSAMPDVWVL